MPHKESIVKKREYQLISKRGTVVQRFTDFRKAKILQCKAAARGVHYWINIKEVDPHHQGGCSFPQCYIPCKHCVNSIWIDGRRASI
jgi:hypothetical protein